MYRLVDDEKKFNIFIIQSAEKIFFRRTHLKMIEIKFPFVFLFYFQKMLFPEIELKTGVGTVGRNCINHKKP